MADDYGPSEYVSVDIPGVGTRKFPGHLGLPAIQANVKRLMQEAQDAQPKPPTWGQTALDIGTSPETLAGAASLFPGVGTLGAAGIGAGTSLARDYAKGNTDPWNMLINAGIHGGINAIPGGAEALIAKRAVPSAAKVAMGVATGGASGGVKGAITSMIERLLSGGAASQAAAGGGAATTGLAGLRLATGTDVLSTQGLKELVQESVRLANSNAPKAAIDALDAQIAAVRAALAAQRGTATGALGAAGIPFTTAADRAAQAAAARSGQAAMTGGRVAAALRLILAGGPPAADYFSGRYNTE